MGRRHFVVQCPVELSDGEKRSDRLETGQNLLLPRPLLLLQMLDVLRILPRLVQTPLLSVEMHVAS